MVKSPVHSPYHVERGVVAGLLFLLYNVRLDYYVLFNLLNIIRSFLIYIIVNPVAEQQIGVSPPCHMWFLARVVADVVDFRHFHIVAFAHISSVLAIESIG